MVPPASTARVSLPDRYRVVRHLANGGMASVWEAHDELLHRSVAVKVLAPHLAEDLRARARFQREARAAAGLSSHPNVVTIYDVGEHDGQVFMVMELMRGGSVADRLRAGEEITRATALRWLGEAAAALDAAHEAGVVHRDVKPANMLLDGQDRLAIADFGIARVAETTSDLTATGQVLGTAAYISPEQAMGEPAVAASDRYGLAVVAYELLTGTRPFRAEHFAAQARAHVEDRPDPPSLRRPDLPRAVDAVLARGLAKVPSERWPTATEMVGRLEDALEEPPTEATRPLAVVAPSGDGSGPPRAAAAPLPDRARRPAGVLLLAGLAGLALLAVLAVVLFSGGGSNSSPPTKQAANPPTHAKKQRAHKRHRTPTPTPTARATETATPAPTASASATPSPKPSSGGSGGLAKARSLQLQGFNARKAGDYARGLSLSKQALAACGGTHALDPCGYALYEIGADLIGLGQPQAAIPYLQRRLNEYGDNSGGEVAKALQQAQSQAQGGSSGSGGGKGHGKSKANGKKD
jgi:eukaryotic-like serine/threonine-protein kinase